MLLLLLTTVASVSGSRKTTLLSGISFALAVFLSYFTIGILLTFGIDSITNITNSSTSGLYFAAGLLSIVLGILNLKDWVSHGMGGFSMEVPTSWRPKMQEKLTNQLWSRRRTPVGAFIAGLFVSLFLLPCTTGPYFVAGSLLSGKSLPATISYLGLYNLVFILPMITLTLLVYSGFVSSSYINEWRENNSDLLHLISGILLIGIGVFIIFN